MIRIVEPFFAKSNVELLQSAREAMVGGYVIAAGCMARASLELHLRRLCIWNDCQPNNKRASAWLYTEKLFDRRIIDRQTKRAIKAAFKIGHKCAHGRPVDWYEVATLLDIVRGLLTTHPCKNEVCCDQCEGLGNGDLDDDDGGL